MKSKSEYTIHIGVDCGELKRLAKEAIDNCLWEMYVHDSVERAGLMRCTLFRTTHKTFDNKRRNIAGQVCEEGNEIYLSLAKVADKAIGIAVIHYNKLMVYVKPEYRRQGIGTSLAKAIADGYGVHLNPVASVGIPESEKFFQSLGVRIR